MAHKFGEALIKHGLITKEDLSKALERQVIFGGRLGTNLVELGYIKEEELTLFLSRFLNVPYADPTYFENMAPDVLSSISHDIIEKYLIMPIKKDKNTVHIAMLNPKDMNLLNEISFTTGHNIIPYIASELRLLHALEKYYNIRRDIRYVTIYAREAEGSPKSEEIKKPLPKAPVKEAPEVKEEPKVEVKPKVKEKPRVSEEKPEEDIHKKINLSMSNAYDREEIADILIREASSKLNRVVLFVVKGDYVSVWKGKGLTLDDNLIAGIKIPLNQMSLFKEVIERRTFHQGPLVKLPLNDKLMEDMGGDYPQEVIAFPLTIRGKVVSILYGDNGDKTLLLDEFDDMKNLMQMASMAMEILILKRKIMEL